MLRETMYRMFKNDTLPYLDMGQGSHGTIQVQNEMSHMPLTAIHSNHFLNQLGNNSDLLHSCN